MTRFASGDGLNPWPAQVSPWIERDFPAREQAAYASARQQAGSLSVPPLLAQIHTIVALGGIIACALLLPVAFRRRAACAGFLLAVLLALPLSAAITGGLSGPHDRYQARIMWLPPFIAALSFAALRRRSGMRRDAFWSGLEAGVSALLSIVTSFAVARIVGPGEFGIGAAATAVHVVLWVVVNALFADALVQRPTIDDRVLSSAFWASVAVGCIALLLQGAAGWGLAAMLGDHRLVPMALVLAAPLPLVGAAGVIQGLLTRERAYRALALRTLIGQGLGTAVGVFAAFAGAGGWALVCQQAVTTSCGALALLIGRGWTPSRCLDWACGAVAADGRRPADRLHAGADRALPAVRGADRRNRRRRRPGAGAYRVPPGRYGTGTDIHRAVAPDAAGAVRTSARPAGDAGAGGPLAALVHGGDLAALRAAGGRADPGRRRPDGTGLGGDRARRDALGRR